MDDEIQLVSDGDGIVALGPEPAVESFLRSNGLWEASRRFDLQRIRSVLGAGSDVARAASEYAATSGRWIRLTEESARLVEEHGLMESGTAGVSHVMIGVPGKVQSWLQTERGVGSILTNPAALSGVAGLMAQVAARQTMADITAYLDRIDTKVDDVLGKVDDTVLKDMRGARLQIRRALTMQASEGRVSADSWSEVQNASGKLADVQAYALLQVEAIAARLDDRTSVRALATAAGQARPEVQKWLAVLAETFQLQEAFDVIALDKALDESPDVLDARRRGLEADRQDRLASISAHTAELLGRIDTAVGRANRRLPLTREKSLSVIAAGNDVAADVLELQESLGATAAHRSWEPRRLGRVADVGSRVIQRTKDGAPAAAAVAALAAGAVVGGRTQGGDHRS